MEHSPSCVYMSDPSSIRNLPVWRIKPSESFRSVSITQPAFCLGHLQKKMRPPFKNIVLICFAGLWTGFFKFINWYAKEWTSPGPVSMSHFCRRRRLTHVETVDNYCVEEQVIRVMARIVDQKGEIPRSYPLYSRGYTVHIINLTSFLYYLENRKVYFVQDASRQNERV